MGGAYHEFREGVWDSKHLDTRAANVNRWKQEFETIAAYVHGIMCIPGDS